MTTTTTNPYCPCDVRCSRCAPAPRHAIDNLGQALAVMAKAEAAEQEMFEDLGMWSAPGECYRDVADTLPAHYAEAEAEVLRVSGHTWEAVVEECNRRDIPLAGPKWDAIVSRYFQA